MYAPSSKTWATRWFPEPVENKATENTVIDIAPTGTVPEGERITVVYSTGPGAVTIPSGLVGQSEQQVQSALRRPRPWPEAGEEPSDQPAGTVVSLSPAGGDVPPGSTVSYVVSSGPAPETTAPTQTETPAAKAEPTTGPDKAAKPWRIPVGLMEGRQPVDSPRILAGRYEVGELIGRGGMADVMLGRDIRLGRSVAIKQLRADLARDPMLQSRFRREAQAVAGLNHPAIVAVYDTGDMELPGGAAHDVKVPFIVMEYVQGRTLREFIKGHELGIDDSVEYTLGILAALEYSHRSGIVHRDIKPANVMVRPDGSVKVMDFGIARALADSAATMTQTQAVLGTAQYLSPEQARGETVDARSDLYSAGCLLYEMLAGRPPFIGDSPVSVAYQHVRELPEPASRF